MLTVCMLMRDARSDLPAVLDSLESLESHLQSPTLDYVIVDTGSTDGSVDYVQECLPQAHVIRTDWNDHFADARNLAWAQVKQDWVLWLDSDERLSPGTAKTLAHFLETLSPQEELDGVVFRRENQGAQQQTVSWDALTRLVYNPGGKKRLRFVGRVHERLVREEDEGVFPLRVMRPSGLTLIHTGREAAVSAQKQTYYLQLMEMERKSHPSPYLDYHWAIAPAVQQEIPPKTRLEALTHALSETVQHNADGPLPAPHWAGVPQQACLLEIQYLLIESGQSTEMIRFFEAFQQLDNRPLLFAESWGNMALAYLEHNAFQKALHCFYESLNPVHLASDPSQGWHSWRPRAFLAGFYAQRDLPAAHIMALQTLLLDPLPRFAAQTEALSRSLQQHFSFEAAFDMLRRAFDQALAALDPEGVAALGTFWLSLELDVRVLNATLQALITLKAHTLARRLKQVEHLIWGNTVPELYRFPKEGAVLPPQLPLLWHSFSPEALPQKDSWTLWHAEGVESPSESSSSGSQTARAIAEIRSWPAARRDVFCFEKGKYWLFPTRALEFFLHRESGAERVQWMIHGEDIQHVCPHFEPFI